MPTKEKIKEIFSNIEKYDLTEEGLKEIIKKIKAKLKPVKNYPISIDKIEIVCPNVDKKIFEEKEQTKEKKSEEKKQKN